MGGLYYTAQHWVMGPAFMQQAISDTAEKVYKHVANESNSTVQRHATPDLMSLAALHMSVIMEHCCNVDM